MSTSAARLDFDQILCRLNLHAVLPALAELVRLSADARALVAGWNFSWRLSVLGGPATTLRCRDGVLAAFPGRSQPAAVDLLFLSARQLNRSFADGRGLPPLPLGAPWHWAKLRPFVALSKLLSEHLQPSEASLAAASPEWREAHTRLLLGVLCRAAPLVGQYDRAAATTLAGAPPGNLELQVPAFDFTARLGSGDDAAPSRRAADATIIFRDDAALEEALHGRLDSAAAVGLGRLEVHGLVPLADAWSHVLDRVEAYLQPRAAVAA